MAGIGEKLISKIIDENDSRAFIRYGVTEAHLTTEAERKAFRFVVKYAEENGQQAPDFRTVVEAVEGFNYEPNVGDTFEFLAKGVKAYAARVRSFELLQNEASKQFQQLDGLAFAEWMRSKYEQIIADHDTRQKVGVNAKTDVDEFAAEYQDRKAGKSFKVWGSKFPTINREIGGYFSGSMYTWFGRSGRGKSVFTLEEAIESAAQGATVLVWAMEMTKYEVLARAYSALSARFGMFHTDINGQTYDAGFANMELLRGKLTEQNEKQFLEFLKQLNEKLSGTLIIRGVDDPDFTKRSCKELESDILSTKADVVVLDPFYYMDYEKNTSQTAGGDAAATSKRLRYLAGRYKIVLHVVTQADEIKDEAGESGIRGLRAARRGEIKKTKAVLEDATNVLGIDSCDGEGVIELGKGRNGGEGASCSVIYLPNYGIVQELPTGSEAADQFVGEF